MYAQKEVVNSAIIFGLNLFLIQIIVANLSTNQTFKWISHIMFMLAVVTSYIIIRNQKVTNRHFRKFLNINLSIFLLAVALSIREVSRQEEIEILKYSIFITAIFFILRFLRIIKIRILSNLQYISITFVMTFSFLLLPNGQSILNITALSNQKFILLSILFIAALIVSKVRKYFNNSIYTILSYIVILFNLVFSFRNDQFDRRDGSYFHVSYFSEVVRTLKSGGTLLWDTPSQYGFLSVLIPSWIPMANSRQAFYLWQSLVIFTFLIAIYIFLQKIIMNPKQIFHAYGIFSILFFFADPALIGPQPFPSSSAMRFGPSVLLLVFYVFSIKKDNSEKKSIVVLHISLLALSFLWSAESLIYGIAISGMFSIIQVMNRKGILLSLLPGFILITCFAIANIYVLIKVGNFADLNMYFMYSQSYSVGYGSLPLSVFSPMVVLYLTIFGVLIFSWIYIRNKISLDIIFLILSSILIWLTYYLGRAVSNNIMVLLPIMFLNFYLIYIFTSDRFREINNFLKNLYTVFITLFFISIVLVPNLSRSLNEFSFGLSPRLPKTNVTMDAPLATKINSSKTKNLVYSSWAAGVPKELKFEFDYDSINTPLPVPLQLLEVPIDQSTSKKIIKRYLNSREIKEIYFIQSFDNEYERRLEFWQGILSDQYICKENTKTERHLLLLCEKKY